MEASRIASRNCATLRRSRLRPDIRPCLWVGQVALTRLHSFSIMSLGPDALEAFVVTLCVGCDGPDRWGYLGRLRYVQVVTHHLRQCVRQFLKGRLIFLDQCPFALGKGGTKFVEQAAQGVGLRDARFHLQHQIARASLALICCH